MIQRIQSVYLLVAAIFTGLFLYVPLFAINSTVPYKALNCKMGFGAATLLLLLAIVDIFLYSNRKLQITIAWLLIVCDAAVIFFFSVHYHFLLKGAAPAHPGDYIQPRYGAVLPLLVLVFIILAIVAIRKDEKLVRESDRLR